jgi:hypothetical protein
MIKRKIQIDHTKITNLPNISFEGKVIIADQVDEGGEFKTVLWLERSKLRGKNRISLNGAAYKRTSLNNQFVMQKADVLGYHQINKNGEETIKCSIADYNIKSLYELIIH